jgi:hypothetical protein
MCPLFPKLGSFLSAHSIRVQQLPATHHYLLLNKFQLTKKELVRNAVEVLVQVFMSKSRLQGVG